MTIYNILQFFGIPSFIVASIVIVYRRIRGVRLGIQALLRSELIRDWNYYSEKGYAPIYARENFENAYRQYHDLGANGVMDDLRQKFLALPDKPQKEESK